MQHVVTHKSPEVLLVSDHGGRSGWSEGGREEAGREGEGGEGWKERGRGREDALAVTRRLLDLERGTGKLLRERNSEVEARARSLQLEVDESMQQVCVC